MDPCLSKYQMSLHVYDTVANLDAVRTYGVQLFKTIIISCVVIISSMLL